MEIKIDINDVIKKAIGVCTKFGEFWKGITLPNNLGPALSFLLILGLLPFVGNLLAGIIPIPGPFGGWWSRGIMYGLVTGIIAYIFYVFMPIVMGIILAALDSALGINKGKAPAYSTVLAYAAAPAAIGSFFTFIPWIGWLFALVFVVLSLVVTYLAFTEGIGMDSGQAIIMMVIMMVITAIFYAILFLVIVGAIFGVMAGSLGAAMYRGF